MEEADAKQQQEAGSVLQLFMDALEVDEDVAAVLVEEGFTSLEEVAYVPLDEMMTIEGFDEEISNELRSRAKDALLTRALASEEQSGNQPAADLLGMDGMTEELARALATSGICTMEDLAEQAVDDVLDLLPSLSKDTVASLIMTARAPWFT